MKHAEIVARIWFFVWEAVTVGSMVFIFGLSGRRTGTYFQLLLFGSSILLVTSTAMFHSRKKLAVVGLVTSLIGLAFGLFVPQLME